MLPERGPSCGGPSHPIALRPRLIGIREIVLAAETEQRKTVLRKRHRLASHLRYDARVVEDRIPGQIGQKDLHQSRAAPHLPLAIGQRVDDRAKWLFENWQKYRPAFVLLRRQRLGQFLKCLGAIARREMVDI